LNWLNLLQSRAIWGVIVLAVVGGSAWMKGRESGRLNCDAERIASVKLAREQAQTIAAQDYEVTEAHIAQLERKKTIYRNIYHDIERIRDSGCGLSDGGVRIWNSTANAATNPEPANEHMQKITDNIIRQ